MKYLMIIAAAIGTIASAHAGEQNYGQILSEKIGAKRLSLALSLVEAFEKNLICETDAYPEEINKVLSNAFQQAKAADTAKFLARVPRNSKLRASLAFRSATGQVNVYNPEISEEALTKALLNTTFFHYGQGAYGSAYNVTLKKGGVAEEQSLEVLNDAPWYRWNASRNTWKLVRGDKAPFVGHYLQLGTQQYELDNSQDGDLRWVPVGAKEGELEHYQQTLSSNDSFCEA